MHRIVGALALLAACGDTPGESDLAPALQLLKSGNADDRFEAVVRLGEAAGSPGAREALVRALGDRDDAVRLMAAISMTAAEPSPFASAPDDRIVCPVTEK